MINADLAVCMPTPPDVPGPCNSIAAFLREAQASAATAAALVQRPRMDVTQYWEKRRVQNGLRRVLEALQERFGLEGDAQHTDLGIVFERLVQQARLCGPAGQVSEESELDEEQLSNALEELGLWPPELSLVDRSEVFSALLVPSSGATRAALNGTTRSAPSKKCFCEGFDRVPFNMPDFPVPMHLLAPALQPPVEKFAPEQMLAVAEAVATTFCMEQTGLGRVKDFFLTGLLSLEEIQMALPRLVPHGLVEDAVARIIERGSPLLTTQEWQELVLNVRTREACGLPVDSDRSSVSPVLAGGMPSSPNGKGLGAATSTGCGAAQPASASGVASAIVPPPSPQRTPQAEQQAFAGDSGSVAGGGGGGCSGSSAAGGGRLPLSGGLASPVVRHREPRGDAGHSEIASSCGGLGGLGGSGDLHAGGGRHTASAGTVGDADGVSPLPGPAAALAASRAAAAAAAAALAGRGGGDGSGDASAVAAGRGLEPMTAPLPCRELHCEEPILFSGGRGSIPSSSRLVNWGTAAKRRGNSAGGARSGHQADEGAGAEVNWGTALFKQDLLGALRKPARAGRPQVTVDCSGCTIAYGDGGGTGGTGGTDNSARSGGGGGGYGSGSACGSGGGRSTAIASGGATEDDCLDRMSWIDLELHHECGGPYLADAFVRCCQLYERRRLKDNDCG